MALVLLSYSWIGKSSAQVADCLVFGTVKDMRTREKLLTIQAEALDLKWGRYAAASVNDSGRYEMSLGRNGEWLVTINAPGHVSKRVKIMLGGIPEEEWAGGFGMNIDMTLLPKKAGVDYSLFEEPFGIARYNADSARLEWDLDHTERMRARQEELLRK